MIHKLFFLFCLFMILCFGSSVVEELDDLIFSNSARYSVHHRDDGDEKPNKDDMTIGYWWWTWSDEGNPPKGTNLGIAFSGWIDPKKALDESQRIKSKLPGMKCISLGGGNANGAWSKKSLNIIIQAIQKDQFSGYDVMGFDIELGDAGLSDLFATAFSEAKKKKFQVLVTVSHSSPYGFSDSADLMRSFFENKDIDFLSPQLYTSGYEPSNDYTISHGVEWSEYKQSKAQIIPSIVAASYYSDCKSYFGQQGVNTSGFIQWRQ